MISPSTKKIEGKERFLSNLGIIGIILSLIGALGIVYSDSPGMGLLLTGHFHQAIHNPPTPLLPTYLNVVLSLMLSFGAYFFVKDMIQ